MTTNDISPADTGSIITAIIVIRGEILIIIMNTPTSVATDVIMVVILWLSPCPSVSTSFVVLERTSPYVLLSKYFIGIRLIFSDISLRSL